MRDGYQAILFSPQIEFPPSFCLETPNFVCQITHMLLVPMPTDWWETGLFPANGPMPRVSEKLTDQWNDVHGCLEAHKIHVALMCSWCPFVYRWGMLWNLKFQSDRILDSSPDVFVLMVPSFFVFLEGFVCISLFYWFFLKRQVVPDYVCITVINKCFLKLVNAVLLINSSAVFKLVN